MLIKAKIIDSFKLKFGIGLTLRGRGEFIFINLY